MKLARLVIPSRFPAEAFYYTKLRLKEVGYEVIAHEPSSGGTAKGPADVVLLMGDFDDRDTLDVVRSLLEGDKPGTPIVGALGAGALLALERAGFATAAAVGSDNGRGIYRVGDVVVCGFEDQVIEWLATVMSVVPSSGPDRALGDEPYRYFVS